VSWPHILSLSRMVAGPIVAALVLGPPGDEYLLAAILFVCASFTDLLDGKLARYAQRVSPLGIFLDTTSDKVMVSLVLAAMAIAGLTAAWIPLVVIAREFIISGLRSYAASRRQIISARFLGKGKAALTMAAIPLVLAADDGLHRGALSHLWSSSVSHALGVGASWLLGVAVALTVLSGLAYLADARSLLAPDTEDESPAAVAGRG